MTDIASLKIRIDALEAADAARKLEDLAQKGKHAEHSTDGLTDAFKRMIGPLTAAVSVTAALKKVIDVQREFDTLNAGLITVTGSSENAAIAFEAIQDFASRTPFDLAQATEAFTQLANRGLEPSERALTSYGNTASAMGFQLKDMTEAVAAATAGEMDSLKKFGITAHQEGERVKFTFRGVTTEMGKNTKEIEQYMIALGENNFAGAMAARMDTLDGAISNLGDEWDKMFLNISKGGLGDAVESTVRMATDALAEFNAMLASGQLEAILKGYGALWGGYASDVSETLKIISEEVSETFHEWTVGGESAADLLSRAWSEFPVNIRALMQLAATELANFVTVGEALMEEVKDIMDPFDGDTFDLSGRLEDLSRIRDESIDSILAERNAALDSYDAQIKKAEELRATYDKKQKDRSEDKGDRLEGFGLDKGGGAPEGESKADIKARDKEEKRQTDYSNDLFVDLEALEENFASENELLAERLEENQMLIEESFQYGFVTEMERKVMLEDLELRHQAKLGNIHAQAILARRKFEEKNTKEQTKFILGEMVAITAGVAQHNRAMFEINKAAGIANATISTYEGVTKALGAYSPPVNFVMAALVAAAGFAQISAISSTSFGGGGGGSTPSSVGAAPVVNDVPQQGGGSSLPVPQQDDRIPMREVNISLNGAGYSKEGVRELIEAINEEVGDGVSIRAK